MFGIGMQEMIVILVIALIFIGPSKLPEIAKGLGRAFSEFKKATNDFKETIGIDNEMQDVKNAFDEMNKDIKETIDLKPPSSDKTYTEPDAEIPVKEPEIKNTDKPTDAE